MQIIWSIILFITFVGTHSELSGDNVCIKEIEKTFHLTRKVAQSVQIHTTEPCADITQGFQCTVKKNGTKTGYKSVPEVRKVNVTACCEGFTEVKGKCLSAEQLELASSNRTKIGFGVIAMAFVIAVLAGVVFYYRKKYRKQKDPKLPTVTYQPTQPTAIFQEVAEPHQEFQNPLFTRPVEMSQEEMQLEKFKIGGKTKVVDEYNNTSRNIYATVEDVNNRTDSASSSSSFLKPDEPKNGFANPNTRESCLQPLLDETETASIKSQH
uniref:EMI domain-containing protein n=1 Tax=Panagrolaimus superbus TaxID=310955 RepID=A0A914Z1T6_9BILA